MSSADTRPSGLPPAKTDDLIGTLLADRYRITEPLAHGGMGAVFLGVDQRSGDEVAIKIVRGELAQSEEALARFRREVRAVATLDSPYVVVARDAGTIDGMPYLVMERLRGQGLDELATGGELPPRRAVRVVVDVLTGLAHAHGAGIIHRDLKPSNIWITDDGRVKILDFGVAKVQGTARAAGDETGKLTDTGAVLGSPAYMSPEQLVSSKEADERADIWSAGTVLYELLSGSMLFKAETVGGIFANVIRMRIPPLREVVPGASPELERIVGRCLERDAEERFSSAAAVADALRALLEADERGEAPLVREGLVDAAKPPSVTIQADGTDTSFEESPTVALPEGDAPDGGSSDPRRRSRLWLLGVALVAIVGSAMVVFGDPSSSSETSATPSSEPRSLETAATTTSPARDDGQETVDAPVTASAPPATSAPAPTASATDSAGLQPPPRPPPAPLRPPATVPPEDDLWETSRH